jgi:hypothetical protein
MDKQSEKSPVASPSGIAEETEIKFIPESSQWDSVRQANELIEAKKKRRAASRARQQDLEKSAHSIPSAALSVSSRGSSDKELSGLSDELQLAPSTDTEATPSKPSKWDLMKSASASTTGSTPMESIVEDKAIAEIVAAGQREERRKKRRSKLDGVKMGVEVVNKTKKPTDESKGSSAGEGTGISSDNNKAGDGEMKTSKKGDKKANKVTAEASINANSKEISLLAKAGYEADTTSVVQIGTPTKDVVKPSASKAGDGEAPKKEKRVSRWRAMKKGMEFVKSTKQEVEAGKADKAVKTTETTPTATTPPAPSSEVKVKRSMWDTLKLQADPKTVPPPAKASTASAAANEAMSPADVHALEKEQRRAAREAKRAAKKTSRWTGLKSGMDFISKTKKQADDKKSTK